MSARSEASTDTGHEARGELIAVANGRAQIRVLAAAACGACASRGACTAGGSAAASTISIAVTGPAEVGDVVTLPASAPVFAALLGYWVPPLCLLAGALGATLLAGGDAAAVAGAALGFCAGLVLVRQLAGRPWVRALCALSCETTQRADAAATDSSSGETQ